MSRTADLTRELRETRTALEDAKVQLDLAGQHAVTLDQLNDVKRRLNEAQIQAAKVAEDNARERREIEHMVGLERKRSETETELAKRDAILTVREEALDTARAAFAEKMEFVTKRFEATETNLKGIVEQVLDRLPTVTVDRQITTGRRAAPRS